MPSYTDGDQWDHMCELASFFHLRDQTWLGGQCLYPLTVSLAAVEGGGCDCHGTRPASETGVWNVQKHLIVQGAAAYNKAQAQDVNDSTVGKDWFRHTTIHPSPLSAKYTFSLTWVSLFKTARYCEQLHIDTDSGVICVLTWGERVMVLTWFLVCLLTCDCTTASL